MSGVELKFLGRLALELEGVEVLAASSHSDPVSQVACCTFLALRLIGVRCWIGVLCSIGVRR